MKNLEQFINDNDLSDYDPIIKMVVIYFQFESIHPFYDGNGRTGRIINILYLILNGLQNLPILYLSSYIKKNKADYYRLLQGVRDKNDWEEWLLFMVNGVAQTLKDTVKLITEIKHQMADYKNKLRSDYKFYSQELTNNLFKHPYTRIEFVVNDLGVTRLTAANYLNKLAADGLLKKECIVTANYYINEPLFNVLTRR